MTWQQELDERERRLAFAHRLGGEDKVRRQHDAGRLTVRERIDRLVDAGSFHEVGALAGKARYDENGVLRDVQPANCVFGRARVGSRPVVVVGDDFTLRGGSADATIHEKPVMAEQMAAAFRIPIIRIIEGSGGGGSVRTIETTGRANLPGGIGHSLGFHLTTDNLGQVPVVSLGLGSVAGLGAARLAASHYSLMTKSSAMFVAGPPVVARLGQALSKQELGGWEVQTRSGAVDDATDTEGEAFERARRFLSYLPSSIDNLPARSTPEDSPTRRGEALLTAIPREIRRVYRMRPILEQIFDKGSLFEVGQHYGRSLITALARLDGYPVAVMAGDPYHYGGAWTADACQKVVRHCDMAETFHLPMVYLVDCPGFLIGPEAERDAVIRHGVRAMAAMNQTTVPWCSILVRNVFGVAGAVHKPAGRLAIRYAWPSARWGSLPLEGGIEAAYRAELDAAEEPRQKLAEITTRLDALRSPFRTAESFWVEDIIDPRDTRRLLCDFATLAQGALKLGPAAFTMRP